MERNYVTVTPCIWRVTRCDPYSTRISCFTSPPGFLVAKKLAAQLPVPRRFTVCPFDPPRQAGRHSGLETYGTENAVAALIGWRR